MEKKISGFGLKLIACLSMLIDHTAAALIENGYYFNRQTQSGDGLVVLDMVMRGLGRFAFVIFCFLLVEGYQKTHSKVKYFLNLIIFGLVSEVPFDLAFQNTVLTWKYQNVYFNLAFSLLALAAWDRILKGSNDKNFFLRLLMGIWAITVIAAIATFARTDYGCFGVLLVMSMYIFKDMPKAKVISGAIVLLFTSPLELVAVPIYLLFQNYNGQRGKAYEGKPGKAVKYFFYVFYPLHLTILILIRYLVFHV